MCISYETGMDGIEANEIAKRFLMSGKRKELK